MSRSPTRSPGRPGRLAASRHLRDGGVIAVAMAVTNLGTYGFTVVAARLLGPRDYGGLAAVMGIFLVIGVVSLGLQATAARRVAAHPGSRSAIQRSILRAGLRTAVVLGGATALAAPLVTGVLRLDGPAPALLLAASVVPFTQMGATFGVLQGERRWGALAALFVTAGVGRLVCGVVGMLIRPDVTGAMTGVAVGAVLPALGGWLVLRRRPDEAAAERAPGPERRLLVEVLTTSHVLLAFFTLSNADVVLARTTLDDHQSGLYAAGLIMAKAVLFLPQFVVVTVFPELSRAEHRHRVESLALAVVLGIGTLATLGTWLLPGLAVAFVGGGAYTDLGGRLWAFAAVGTVLAMQQLLVYGSVARRGRSAVRVLWSGLVVLVLAGLVADSLTSLLVTVAAVQTAALGLLVAASSRAARSGAAEGAAPAARDRT